MENQLSSIEQAILNTIRVLSPIRVQQVLDFAQWLKSQPTLDETLEAELELEEKAWEQSYMANRETFRSMAYQALDDLKSGKTLEMVIENDKVTVR